VKVAGRLLSVIRQNPIDAKSIKESVVAFGQNLAALVAPRYQNAYALAA